jgi:hypothetical protein
MYRSYFLLKIVNVECVYYNGVDGRVYEGVPLE